jgi:CubicO group peptidase (beta-lactamase class C family)
MSCAFAAFLVVQTLAAQAPESSPVPPDSEIRKILVDRIDAYRQSVGIVVGVIEPKGRRIVAYCSLDQGDPRTLNGDTVFEIGSVTKVVTSLLLSDMVQRGQVGLTDPVSKYLPAGVKTPQRNGRQITLLDLSTHTSGLPRMPTNFNPDKPYADYTVAQLYEFLSSYQLPRDIGAQYEYSNVGAGLLANALAFRPGMDYDALGLVAAPHFSHLAPILAVRQHCRAARFPSLI